MDDAALAIRRARRAGAKRLDLSQRGLPSWPEDLFALRQLEALDISRNELSSVAPNITALENLEELDLSGNRIDSLSDLCIVAAGLKQLRSLVLDGNPVAARLGPSVVRQLARPPAVPGQSFAKVICNILHENAASEALAPPPVHTSPPPQHGEVLPFDTNDSEDEDEVRPPQPLPQAPLPPPGAPAAMALGGGFGGGHGMMDVDRALAGEGDSAWRKEQRVMQKEIERLQARVRELEEESARRPPEAAAGGGGSAASSLPSWLQQDTRPALAATLPSRRGGLMNDEVTELRNQLREEQRKNKRLEQDVKRLTDRAQERDMGKASVGSVPHFEWTAEVELGDIINQGGFSVVHKGYWHGTKVAIKKLFDPNITEELLSEFDNEVQKLEQIRHPHILLLLAVHRKPPALSIITELVEGGSMYQLVHTPARFNFAPGVNTSITLKEGLDILEVAGGAIAFLHARGIAHRDIKTHNILLSPSLDVKLCDFGLARMRSELMTGSMQFAGTPNYMAPEIFRNQKYSENVDVFAFGTVLWEVAAGDIPWANMDPPDIRERVIEGQMLPIPRTIPHELQSLIQDCWTADRNSRPPMATIVAALRVCPREVGSGGAAARARRPQTAMGVRDSATRHMPESSRAFG